MIKGNLTLFGDSIASGLGARGRSYGHQVADSLGLTLHDYSVSGSTVQQSLQAFRENPCRSEIALIAHGVTEPIIRPRPEALRLLPPRWQRRGWMDPRAYYSSRLVRYFFERMESEIRWRTKNLAIRVGGPHQVLSAVEYTRGLASLAAELSANGARVIVLGPPDVDEVFFPGSPAAQQQYFLEATKLGLESVSLNGKLKRWSDFNLDRFHLNDEGHTRVARIILDQINQGAKQQNTSK